MKILQVRFKNLNSLVGEWNIDFTDPAYSEDGIFAITGPTGSGKTTILDAICLALYGRTPRLDSISASSNEIMSRQTGECFAEVLFSLGSGRYRCHWGQRRSRKKADGNLQAATREFVDDETNTVLENKLKTVTTAVIEKTGMTFDQFTRSMLLAQGGFAAFLLSPEEGRSKLLEQITGTEIYSQISVKVHEMRGEQRGRLEQLQAANGSIQLLTENETLELNARINEQDGLRATAVQRKNGAQASLNWLDQMTALANELTELDQRWAQFEERRDLFSSEKLSLELAEKARALQVAWTQLDGARTQCAKEAELLNAAETQWPELEKQGAAAQCARDAVREKLDQLRIDHKSAIVTLKAVRELDVRIATQQQAVQVAETEGRALTDKLAAAEGRRAALEIKIGAALEASQLAVDYLSEHAADASLAENLTALRERFDALAERLAAEEKATVARSVAQMDLEKAHGLHRTQTAAHAQQVVDVRLADEKVKDATAVVDALLNDREPARIQQELDESRVRNQRLSDLMKRVQEVDATELEIAAKRVEKTETALSWKEGAADLVSAETERNHCKEHLQAAESELELIRRVSDLEEQRARLQDGHPCPLCGSRHHPYAAGYVLRPSEAEAAVVEAKARFEKARDAVIDLEKNSLLVGQSIEQLHRRILELEEERARRKIKVEEVCAPLALDGSAVSFRKVNRLLTESSQRVQAYSECVDAVNRASKYKATALAEREAVQSAFHHSETAVLESAAAVEKQTLLRDQARVRVAERAAETERVKTALLGQLSIYGIGALSDAALDELNDRSQQWKTAQAAQVNGELALTTLRSELEHVLSSLSENRAYQVELQQKQVILTKELFDQQQKRRDLFGEKLADAEEAAWTCRIESAEREQEAAAQVFVELDKKRDGLATQITALKKTQTDRAASMAQQESAFCVAIQSKGFAGESDYQAALLPEEKYAALVDAAELLKNEQTEIGSLRQSKSVQLDTERAKKVTDQSREDLTTLLSAATEEESAITERIGGFRQQLRDDAAARSTCAGQLEIIAAQQATVDRWDRLHVLIGSGDGKRFRNFAQGLTFELVIAQANRQLRKMTDRYLLVHDGKQPLDLNVIDDYQGGEIRSTKNLSGGESFIVSLALALGLAHMASRNVRVDSLFLDEGFGTLDEDALEIALDTLAGLQEEGKLIGVISHVPQLKERIRTQIQVEPQSGGRSIITGAGCQ